MQEEDKKLFFEIMTALASIYGTSFASEALNLFFAVLAKYSVDDVKKAAILIARSRKYTKMPTIADFVEAIEGGDVTERSDVAAAAAIDAVSTYGCYHSVEFDDPVLMAVIDKAFRGWPAFCAACVGDELKFIRHELAKLYRSFYKQRVWHKGHLPGLNELNNASNGFEEFIPAPKRIAIMPRENCLVLPETVHNRRVLPIVGSCDRLQ